MRTLTDDIGETELEARAKSEPHLALPEWTFATREDPGFFRPFADLRTHVFADGQALPRKYRELLHLCLLAYRLAPKRSMVAHLRRAREAGASPVLSEYSAEVSPRRSVVAHGRIGP
jgi:alkylhydroperoxidase/carboxymuconolactone decarboxylase family protein YurZ